MSSRIKNILAVIAVIAIAIAVVNLAVPYVVNPEKTQTELQNTLKTVYSLDLKSEGKASVATFPSPKLYLQNIKLSDATGRDVLSAPSVIIHIGWLGLMNGNAESVEIIRAEADLTPATLTNLLGGLASPQKATGNVPLNLQFSDVSLDIAEAGEMDASNITQLGQINGSVKFPSEGQNAFLNTTLQYNGRPLTINALYNPKDQNKTNIDITLNNNVNFVLDGVLNSASPFAWKGNVTANITDLTSIAEFFNKEMQAIPSGKTESPAAQPIGMQFQGIATIDADGLALSRTEATIDKQKAAFSAYIGWEKSKTVALELSTESADLARWYDTFAPNLMASSVSQTNGIAPLVKTPLGRNTALYIILKVEDANYSSRKLKKFSLDAELEGGQVIVHQAEALMPGESKIAIQGTVIQQPEGQRFSGTAKLEGEHFNEWLADIEPSAKNLPAEDFADFSLGGNLFISNEQLRLSEATLRIHEFELMGGFATYFEETPRVEAEIKLQNANIDYFRDAWREAQRASNNPTYQVLIGDASKFDWLRKLPATFDLTLAIQGFTFLDAPGDYATMRLYMTPGEINLYGIDMGFVDNKVSGNIKFNVTGVRPKLDLTISANTFNTNYIIPADQVRTPFYNPLSKEHRFSEELFDLRWMSALDASFDITLANLMHHDVSYPNFKWKAELQNASMVIQRLGFGYLNGTLDLNGTLIGGTVPGISMSFALINANMPELMRRYFNVEHIAAGNISITGAVTTSGIHMKSWLEQAEVKLTTSARGVRVQNLNLQSVIDITSQARSTIDVAEGVKGKLFDGTTELAVDGTINILQGMMKTPGIRLAYGTVLGNLTGEVQLQNWTLNLSTLWQFPEISSTTIPTMTTNQQGDINDYTTRIDTSSLEAFVAKRIIGQ